MDRCLLAFAWVSIALLLAGQAVGQEQPFPGPAPLRRAVRAALLPDEYAFVEDGPSLDAATRFRVANPAHRFRGRQAGRVR